MTVAWTVSDLPGIFTQFCTVTQNFEEKQKNIQEGFSSVGKTLLIMGDLLGWFELV